MPLASWISFPRRQHSPQRVTHSSCTLSKRHRYTPRPHSWTTRSGSIRAVGIAFVENWEAVLSWALAIQAR